MKIFFYKLHKSDCKDWITNIKIDDKKDFNDIKTP